MFYGKKSWVAQDWKEFVAKITRIIHKLNSLVLSLILEAELVFHQLQALRQVLVIENYERDTLDDAYTNYQMH